MIPGYQDTMLPRKQDAVVSEYQGIGIPGYYKMNRNLRFGAKTVRSTPGSVHPAQNLTGNRLRRVAGLENDAKSKKI